MRSRRRREQIRSLKGVAGARFACLWSPVPLNVAAAPQFQALQSSTKPRLLTGVGQGAVGGCIVVRYEGAPATAPLVYPLASRSLRRSGLARRGPRRRITRHQAVHHAFAFRPIERAVGVAAGDERSAGIKHFILDV